MHEGSSCPPWFGNGTGLGRSNRAQDVFDAAVVAVVHQSVGGAGVDQSPFDISAIELAGMDKLQQTECRAIQGVVSAAICSIGKNADFIFESDVGIGFGASSAPIGLPPPHCCL